MRQKLTTARASGQRKDPCVCKIDRFRGYTHENPTDVFIGHPGFRRGKACRIEKGKRFEPYGRAHWFHSRTSRTELCIESKPRETWIAPFRITLYADDRTGLLPDDVLGALELLPGKFKLSLIELAFDFSGPTIDRQFVRHYGLFGRSRRAQSSDVTDYWGSRRSGKLIKSYTKTEIDAHRVEFEFGSRFLRRNHIDDPFGFPKLNNLVPRNHFYFAKLDVPKLTDHLRRRGVSREEVSRHLRWLDPSKCNIGAALAYLREELHMTNARRFLIPLRANRFVREALEIWCPKWVRPRHALDESSRKKK
jgi:hypothetical protein